MNQAVNFPPRDLKADIRGILAPMYRGDAAEFQLDGHDVVVDFTKHGVFQISMTRQNDKRSGRFLNTPSLKEAVNFICW